MKKKYIFLIIFLLLVLVVGTISFLPKLMESTQSGASNPDNGSSSTAIDKNDTTDTKEPINNKPQVFPETPIVVPDEMQAIIDENQENLFKDASQQLAPAFPVQMVPLYGVSDVSDSYGITNNKGKPGWNTTYVSNNTVEELLEFYSPLLSTSADFVETPNSAASNLKATVSGYAVSVTITPNNPQKTDLQGNSSVNIFIEEL